MKFVHLALAFILGAVVALGTGRAFGWTHGAPPTGQGGGQYLLASNLLAPSYGASATNRTIAYPAVSTADYYHVDGLYRFRPSNLCGMGAWGIAIAQTKSGNSAICTATAGYYVWPIVPDHGQASGSGWPSWTGWSYDGDQGYVGYSADPGVPPDPSTMVSIVPAGTVAESGTGGTPTCLFAGGFPKLVYNADEATNKAYFYVECFRVDATNNNSWNQALFKGASFDAMTYSGIGPMATVDRGFASNSNIFRSGANTWFAYGGGQPAGGNDGSQIKWTSSDGATWATGATPLTATMGSGATLRKFSMVGDAGDQITFSGNTYWLATEDARSGPGGMYATLYPIDASGNLNTSGTPPITRISNQYTGTYPGPTYLQSATTYVESGFALTYAMHGFFPSGSQYGLTTGDYASGGGLQEDYIDLYAYCFDNSSCVNAAPMGVAAYAVSGVVTLTWFDINPNHTYRVKDCSTDITCASPTTLGNPTSGQFSHTPTSSSSCSLHYYQVLTTASGTEQGARIVGLFVGNNSRFVNQHITRVCKAGADYTTIDQTWMTTVDNWLQSTCNCLYGLLYWSNASFGIVRGSGQAINKIMDLGTSRLPRGGDLTPSTPASSTYSTTGCNSAVPGWVNASGTARQYYGGGRINNIRRKAAITLIAGFAAGSNGDLGLFGSGNGNGAFYLRDENTGPPRTASFAITDSTTNNYFVASTNTADSHTTRIVGASWAGSGSNVKIWLEGTSTSAAGPADNSTLTGYMGASSGQVPFLASGSYKNHWTDTARSYDAGNAAANDCDRIVFDIDLSALTCGSGNCLDGSNASSLTSLLRTRYGN